MASLCEYLIKNAYMSFESIDPILLSKSINDLTFNDLSSLFSNEYLREIIFPICIYRFTNFKHDIDGDLNNELFELIIEHISIYQNGNEKIIVDLVEKYFPGRNKNETKIFNDFLLSQKRFHICSRENNFEYPRVYLYKNWMLYHIKYTTQKIIEDDQEGTIDDIYTYSGLYIFYCPYCGIKLPTI